MAAERDMNVLTSMGNTVNFPERLDISPSIVPKELETSSGDTQTMGMIFGSVAQRKAIENYGIAGRVWEAAYALCLYVQPPPNLEFDPPFARRTPIRSRRTFLELGAGTGIVSSRIAEILGSGWDTLIVTDLPEVCPLLENNVRHFQEAEHPNNVFVRPLAWGNKEHIILIASELLSMTGPNNPTTMSYIICSDLVYFPELFAPLLRTLLELTSPPFSLPTADDEAVTIFISYRIRSLSKETAFWTTFGLWFNYEPVLVRDRALGLHWQRFGSSLDETTFVFTARRRLISFSWEIPLNDDDLLLGRGARGNQAAKEDDTFEMLLLTNLSDI